MHRNTLAILPSQNEARGFLGRIQPYADSHQAWVLAMTAIANTTGCSDEAVRAFLDSRYGRRFADEVANGLIGRLELPAAIESAIGRWMGWRIDARIETELGIPQGLPYLTGFVCMHQALMEAEAD